jgi:hypothetical protein
VLPNSAPCPADPEETAQQYCDGTLDHAEAAAFEAHYMTCRDCGVAVKEAGEYLRSQKIAERKARTTPLR